MLKLSTANYRWAGAPKKWAFLKSVLNIVDVAAIAPYYLTLFFVPSPDFGPRDPTALITTTMEPLMAEQGEMAAVEEEEEEGGFGNVGRVMQVFRIARIMRIFKLARRSVGLQSMAHTVKTSWKDLGLLFMLVGMGQLVFGSLLYYIESGEEDTGFTSIPQVQQNKVNLKLCPGDVVGGPNAHFSWLWRLPGSNNPWKAGWIVIIIIISIIVIIIVITITTNEIIVIIIVITIIIVVIITITTVVLAKK